MIQRSKKVIRQIKIDIGQKPGDATTLIKFMNSKNREELEKLGIKDMKETILEVRRMHTKRNLMLQVDNKFQGLETSIQRFHKKMQV